jgi:cytochrome c-type biogenesis protein CcmE
MAQATWEKSGSDKAKQLAASGSNNRIKFTIAGILMLVAVGYLIIAGTLGNTQYFVTVESLTSDPALVGETVRISGAVIGETIEYDEQNLILDFEIAHIPETTDDLALTLHQAVTNPTSSRIPVHIENEVMPDLLQNEAQAILTGYLADDGVFYATELLLKCPSRYEEIAPEQAAG